MVLCTKVNLLNRAESEVVGTALPAYWDELIFISCDVIASGNTSQNDLYCFVLECVYDSPRRGWHLYTVPSTAIEVSKVLSGSLDSRT